MSKPILLRGARQLLTLQGSAGARRGPALSELGLMQNASILIADGVIQEVGPGHRVENLKKARGAEEIDVSGRVVMPGFVDSHTHLVCGPPRLSDYEMRLGGANYQEIAAAGGGILWTMRSVRSTPIRGLELQARKAIDSFVRHGTTTIEAKSGYGLDSPAEIKCLRIVDRLSSAPVEIVPTYLGAHVTPPEFADNADGYIDWMCSEMLPEVSRRGMARFADVYCERGAFTVEQSRRYLQAAARLGFSLKIHADQFTSSGGTRLAVELRATSADHLESIAESDIKQLARSTTVATLLPGSVFHLALDRYAPARQLIDAGAAIALATDFNPGTSPTMSMPMVIALACTQMRMKPAEAIAASTINAAHALGLADRIGSLQMDKDADLIVLNVSDYREIPYHFGVNPVAMTMKKGKVVYREGDVSWPEES
jgi:imidazolonepropionase